MRKRKVKAADKKIGVDRRTTRTRNLSPFLNEVLFKLWMEGKPIKELLKVCEAEGCYLAEKQLNNAIQFYKWAVRRRNILVEVTEEMNRRIIESKVEELNAFLMVKDANLKEIEKMYWAIMNNEKIDSFLIAKDFNQFKSILGYCREILEGKPEGQPLDAENNGVSSQQVQVIVQQAADNRDSLIEKMKRDANRIHLGEKIEVPLIEEVKVDNGK